MSKHERTPIRLRSIEYFNRKMKNYIPMWVMDDMRTGKRWKFHIHFDFSMFQRYYDGVESGMLPYNTPTEYQEMFGPVAFQFHVPFAEWGVGETMLQKGLDCVLGTVLGTLRVRVSRNPVLAFNERVKLIHPIHLDKLKDSTDTVALVDWIKSGEGNLVPDPETHSCFGPDYTIAVDKHLFQYDFPLGKVQEVVGEIALTYVNGVLLPHFHFTDVVGKKVKPPPKPTQKKRKNSSFCYWKEKLMKYK